MCYFFRIYLDFFSFFFCPLFHFHWKESSKSAERKALSSVLERRGERDEERRADEVAGGRWGRGEGQGIIFLSSPSRSFSLHQRGASLWHTSVMRKIPPACLASGRWRWPVWAPPVCSCPRPSSSSGTPATSRGRQQTRRPLLLPLSPLMTDRNGELQWKWSQTNAKFCSGLTHY